MHNIFDNGEIGEKKTIFFFEMSVLFETGEVVGSADGRTFRIEGKGSEGHRSLSRAESFSGA